MRPRSRDRRRRDARTAGPHRRRPVAVSTRSGFVALAGRPNVGKSTLVNRVVGEKVAIVSDRPQTTRRAIRGIATGDDWQLVIVDLPGVQRPRDPLTERMQRRTGGGASRRGPPEKRVDRLDRRRAVEALAAAAELELQGEIFPISALTGDG